MITDMFLFLFFFGNIILIPCIFWSTGVESVAADLNGQNLSVVGSMDPVELVMKLRKLEYAEIVSIGSVRKEKEEMEEKKEEMEEKKEEKKEVLSMYYGNTSDISCCIC